MRIATVLKRILWFVISAIIGVFIYQVVLYFFFPNAFSHLVLEKYYNIYTHWAICVIIIIDCLIFIAIINKTTKK